MRVLVTGASGFLGAALLERTPPDVDATGASHRRPADVKLDITSPDSISDALDEVRPDAVIHGAAMARLGECTRDPEQAYAVNADGAGYLASICAQRGIRLVALSTDYVFDGRRGGYREDDEVSPINAYGRSKAAGERLVLSAHPAALVVRTSAMVGRARGGGFPFSSFVLDHRGPEAIELFADEVRSFVPVTVMADALWELVASAHRGILHVAGTEGSSRPDFGRALLAAAGRDDVEIVESPTPPGRAHDLSLDVSRAQQVLQTPLPDLATTVGLVIEDRTG